jgi:hypothetical protein
VRTIVATFIGIMLIAGKAPAQQATITVDEIQENAHIRGTVNGLSAIDAANYCVVVYVHTDKWYIHPFANGGDGKSWASIRDGRTWKISTVKREYSADKIAAVLLTKNGPDECTAPATTDDPSAIPRRINTDQEHLTRDSRLGVGKL